MLEGNVYYLLAFFCQPGAAQEGIGGRAPVTIQISGRSTSWTVLTVTGLSQGSMQIAHLRFSARMSSSSLFSASCSAGHVDCSDRCGDFAASDNVGMATTTQLKRTSTGHNSNDTVHCKTACCGMAHQVLHQNPRQGQSSGLSAVPGAFLLSLHLSAYHPS